MAFFSKFFNIPNWFKIAALLILLIIYTVFTGSSPSVVRAASMTLTGYIIYIFRSANYIYNSVGVTSFVMLLINPFLLFNIGFQFSFLAVLSILYFTKPIMKYFPVKHTLLKLISQVFVVSCTVQILLAPLIIYYFNQYSLGFLFTNFSSIVTAYIIIIFSFLIVFFEGANSCISELLGLYSNSILEYHHLYLQFIEEKNYLLFDQLFLNKYSLLMIYSSILMSMLWIYKHSYLKLGILICSVALTFIIMRNNKFQTLDEKYIVFYNSKKPNHIDFIYNGICYSYIDESVNVDYNNYKIFRISKYISQVIQLNKIEYYCDTNIIKDGPFIQFGNKIFAINPSSEIRSTIEIDYTYFDNEKDINEHIYPKELRITNFKITPYIDKIKAGYNLNIQGSLVLQL